EGETVRITLSLREWTPEGRYLFSFAGDRNLQHGTLEPVPGEVGVFLYHATSVGVDSFTFTVTRDGVVSTPGTITITVTPSPIQPFLKYFDMPSHWASYAAGRLATLEKIIGHRVDSRFFFHPDRGITRGDFLIWLCAVMGIEPTDDVDTIFADPDIPVWMKGFIVAATEENIIEGVPSASYQQTSYFLPNRAITRIEAIRMISAALGVAGHDDDLTGLFNDIADIPDWGKIHVRHLAELQIITGDGSGYLRPARNLSRGEAAEMLYKTYKELQVAPDLNGDNGTTAPGA
ncbi:MAG: S-layer homology domain-containing protein, partial [Oscillospiraceae bacterium]|nr:S-layer homology domain-containing protein [Oscillospiraceae bacterium]